MIMLDDWYVFDFGFVCNCFSSGGIIIEFNLMGWCVGVWCSEMVVFMLVSCLLDIGVVVGGCCVLLSLGFSEVMDVDVGVVVELIGLDGKMVVGNLVWWFDGLSVGFMLVLLLVGGSYMVCVVV